LKAELLKPAFKRILLLVATILVGQAMGMEIDTGKDAAGLAETLKNWELANGRSEFSGWVRLRGVDLAKEAETRVALLKLRELGYKTCVMLRWPAQEWKRVYLPKDLREANAKGRELDASFGDLVDAWEVDNEPDLGFVPESAERYTAFLKAMYLGLKAGSTERGPRGQDPGQVSSFSSQVLKQDPLVIMGSLGLPPGPWLERFAANCGFAYTDGFNYHYYGYAEDFSAVYRQHETAASELSALNAKHAAARTKELPVILTEVGYGMLDKLTRENKEGRIRQWRWFRSIGIQAQHLRIEAPMAFLLIPYLDYDIVEFGLTTPAKQTTKEPVAGQYNLLQADGMKRERGAWVSGGIRYTPEDFGLKSAEPWMDMIGKKIDGNDVTPALAQWLALRRATMNPASITGATTDTESGRARAAYGDVNLKPENFKPNLGLSSESRSWIVTATAPSPVVIDFIDGQGLSFVKRYNGSFVMSKSPVVPEKAVEPKPESKVPDVKSQPEPVRAEEFTIQIRTQNGNLFEVYPTRTATAEWQNYLEPYGNFTMSFFGRAELPWRFKDNKPASLVVVMYPKQLPATFEFRRVQLRELGSPAGPSPDGTRELDQEISFRHGVGTVVLYNFSNKPVTGRLQLPEVVGLAVPVDPDSGDLITLAANERREIPVSVKVRWGQYERIEALLSFVPRDSALPTARFLTTFLPDIGGIKTRVIADMLPQQGEPFNRSPIVDTASARVAANYRFIAQRVRVSEEEPMAERDGYFAQQGAIVEKTSGGFLVKITKLPPGKPQRVEVEIPWPDALPLSENNFINLDFRLISIAGSAK
jgi:hypothetical protein